MQVAFPYSTLIGQRLPYPVVCIWTKSSNASCIDVFRQCDPFRQQAQEHGLSDGAG